MSDSFETLQIVAHQSPLSTVFSRQRHWSWLPCPFSGDCPNPGTEPSSPELQVYSLLLCHQGAHLTDNQGNKKMILVFLTESVLGYDTII